MKNEWLKENWTPSNIGMNAASDWDSRSQRFIDKELPDDNELPLSLVIGRCMAGKKPTLLDIGCGAGTYSLPLAGRSEKVLGIDISSSMISAANKKAESMGLDNALYEVRDWITEGLGCNEKFDVVLAHMTPAISSYDSFNRLLDAVDGTCFLTKSVHREDTLKNKVFSILDIEEHDASRNQVFSLNMLWNLGLTPDLYHEVHTSNESMDVDQAVEYLCRSPGLPLKENREEISKVVEDLSKDGHIEFTRRSVIATLVFRTN